MLFARSLKNIAFLVNFVFLLIMYKQTALQLDFAFKYIAQGTVIVN